MQTKNQLIKYSFACLVLGTVIGLVVGTIVFKRYEISSGGLGFVNKIDKWSGDAWIQKHYWDENGDTKFYWQPIQDKGEFGIIVSE
ncbi:MAG: hypothetical protein Q8Q48_00550 [Candidatus Staskawiczbacteria bacterium]|nr:hypothetical protein [Candidatus Staskawiczbacteria bacterium]